MAGSSKTISAPGVTINYRGFEYGRTPGPFNPPDDYYFTGDTLDGDKVYLPVWSGSKPQKVPEFIYLKSPGRSDACYALNRTAKIYAYTLCSAYNTGEMVYFGLVNDIDDRIILPNSAPWEIERKKEGGSWEKVFDNVVRFQAEISVGPNDFKEWQWNQDIDIMGNKAQFGDYRVVIDDKYIAKFRIYRGAPVVDASEKEYPKYDHNDPDKQAVDRDFDVPPMLKGISDELSERDHGASLREYFISWMMYKAYVKGLNQHTLMSAMNAVNIREERFIKIPYLAIHALYDGSPAWIIAYSEEGHRRYCVVGDASGKKEHCGGCR